jgi:hypothetical protein
LDVVLYNGIRWLNKRVIQRMNRKIGIICIIGLLLAGLIGYYLGHHFKPISSVENTLAKITSSPSPIVTPLSVPIVTASPSPSASTPTPTEPPSESNENKGFFSLKSDIDAVVSNGAMHFLATADHRYEVIETKENKVQINFNGLKGWIPVWYLKKDANEPKVIAVKPYLMIVNNTATVWLSPGDQTLTGYEFEAGKVVRVFKEFGEWVCVSFINYAEPNYGDFWVMKKDLIAWDPKKAKEGLLRKGAINKYENSVIERNPIRIAGEKAGKYEIRSIGGFSGEIDKEDFVPNPFIDRPAAPKSPLALIDDLELSPEQEKIFDSYALKRSDDRLKGLSAADIFKFYLEATFRKDQETLYGLYVKGEGYNSPSQERFLHDLEVDPSSADKAIAAWNEIKQNHSFVVQENYMEDSHAVVFIIPLKKEAEMKMFQLYKNKAGIWKVNWMPLQ